MIDIIVCAIIVFLILIAIFVIVFKFYISYDDQTGEFVLYYTTLKGEEVMKRF